MRYGQIRKMDIANGPGIRTSVFVTGCTHHCYNCFNEEYQNPEFGTLWTDKETDQVITVIRRVREAVDTNIWVYSGYVYEELVKDEGRKTLLELCDVLVDGPFQEALKDPGLYFRGSSNQRIINVKETQKQGQVVLLWPDGR